MRSVGEGRSWRVSRGRDVGVKDAADKEGRGGNDTR